jgi:putative endonuclease
MSIKPTEKGQWVVYILQCADGTYYTGITNNLSARLIVHSEGKGAKYTRSRGPLELVYLERQKGKSQSLKREYAIKALSRQNKQALIIG